MQKRNRRKIISIVLTFAIVISTTIALTLFVSANSVNITINGNGSQTIITPAINMVGGDTVTFNLTTTHNNVRIGLIRQSDGMFFGGLIPVGGSVRSTLTIPQAGTYRFRVINDSSTAVTVTGTWTHQSNIKIHDARIRFDTSYGPNNNTTITGLSMHFSNATGGIGSNFGIFFSLIGTQQSADLNGSTCRLADNLFCNSDGGTACGTNSNCNTSHIKGASRLNALLTSPTIHTVRVVGHALCWWDTRTTPGNHIGTSATGSGLGGLGVRPGRNTILTNRSILSIPILMQHELSHNLGATDCSNLCIMNANNIEFNRWCTTCSSAIFTNK
ncbi:MAG: hypothetical protein LBC82_04785 [Oscillospiraceae bacterium]|jgi:hypothetical protein|nr:hypothetical protein [Oscillospiraceae bacterium]